MPERDPHRPSSLGLRRIALLKGLGDARLKDLARECAWRSCPEGQHIITRESQDRDVYLIVSGRVRVTTYSATGRQVTFRDLAAGDTFGDVAAIDDLPRTADVVAIESTTLASMPPAVFWRLIHEEPSVAAHALRRLAALVRLLTERVIDMSTLGVPNRIHAELLRRAREAGVLENAARIDPAPLHSDIASQVSTYREQVTRELSVLARAGIVQRDGGALVVRDVAKLTRLVEDVRRNT